MFPEVGDIEDVAETSPGRKILRITMEFEVGGKKTHTTRLKEAYLAAVSAADEAVRLVLLKDSVKGLTTQVTYGYRHLEGSEVTWDWVDNNHNHHEE